MYIQVKIMNLINHLRSSFWLIPGVMCIVAFILSRITLSLDTDIPAIFSSWDQVFLYQGDIQGARQLLTTIAGSMITISGVTFSITVVALSLTSSQFGPRLLENFMRDRGNQLVLGTFV